jgi:hypothetical protein
VILGVSSVVARAKPPFSGIADEVLYLLRVFVLSRFRDQRLPQPNTIRFTSNVGALKLISNPTPRPVALKYDFTWAKCTSSRALTAFNDDPRGKLPEFMAHGSSSRPITKTRKYENAKKSNTVLYLCLAVRGQVHAPLLGSSYASWTKGVAWSVWLGFSRASLWAASLRSSS